jgi:hypothetical protein
MLSVRDVSAWPVVEAEPLGRDRKVWLRDPTIPPEPRTREHNWLFKPVVVPRHGIPQGEDWVEAIVSRLGGILGVTCAEAALARRHGEAGSISRNVVPDGGELVLGSELMGTVVAAYQEGRDNPPGRPGHSPPRIVEALAECRAAIGHEHVSGAGMFAGYLVLDAWVANQDRHDQNWAVIRSSRSGELRLAPSYDHASSLGFNLLDDRRDVLLRGRDLRRWAERGRARRFEHDPARPRSDVPSLVDVARHMLDLVGHDDGRWLDRLRGIDTSVVEETVRDVPKLSATARTFVVELLDVNRRRLLDEHD